MISNDKQTIYGSYKDGYVRHVESRFSAWDDEVVVNLAISRVLLERLHMWEGVDPDDCGEYMAEALYRVSALDLSRGGKRRVPTTLPEVKE
jgi:hypothetical protein